MSTRAAKSSLGRGGSGYQECQLLHVTSQHGKKNRASQVCQGCRKRKVKCDLLVSGNPCTNCQEDEIGCTALESKRSRRYRLQKQSLDRAMPYTHEISPRMSDNSSYASVGPTTKPLHQRVDRTECFDGSNFAPQPSLSLSHSNVHLPAYVKGTRSGFDPKNAAFLDGCGTLAVPEISVCDELIRCFVLYVHPYLPVLHLQDLFDTLRQTENSDPLSLILFQAVLYAGCAYVDIPVLEALGFRTRIAARKTFYIKVKQLYEFDWEDDPIPVIQALLLITDWFESPDDQKDPWYWLGVCRMVANRIGLGINRSSYVASKACQLWKRLWWMCILRDRVIAVATRKPLQFGEAEIGMPVLTIDDFETQPIHTDIPLLRACEFLTNPGVRQTLARLCIEKINLSGWAARILAQNYSSSSCSEVPATSVMLYSLKPQLENMADNIDLRRKLEHCKKTLPHDCIFAQSPSNIREWSIELQALYLHRAVLRMFSLMVDGLLYRPLASAKMNQDQDSQFLQHEVKQTLEQVANETANIARVFCEHGLVPKLPPFASTLFLSALPTFLVGIQGSTGVLCEHQRLQFRWCSEGIHQQRAIWPTSELAYAMVKAMISRARVRDAWGLTSEPSPYNLTSILPRPSLDLESGVVSHRRNSMDLSAGSPPTADPRGSTDRLSDPGEASVDWASWLDFDEGLFNQLCTYSNVFATH